MTPGEATNKLLEAAHSGKLSDAEAALAAGAGINARDNQQWTPMHLVARNGHTDTVRLLIDKGADLTAMDEWQYTPLHWAAEKGHTDLVTMLQDPGKAQAGHAGRVAKRRGNDEPQIGS